MTFGQPEAVVPSRFCSGFCYKETEVVYPVEEIRFRRNTRGCVLEFPQGEERIYGFGLQLNGFDQREQELILRVNADPVKNTGDSHAPVPFFVTTGGYGIYLDTARNIEVHCGARTAEGRRVISVQVPNASGIEIYIIEGRSITEITAQYNRLSGSGCQVPEWGLGVLYRCNWHYSQQRVLDTAAYFRKADIPCGILGLEPGWHTCNYPCSYQWNRELFPEPEKMVKQLREMGYHLNLWEHAYVSRESPIYEELREYSGSYRVLGGLVPDLATEEGSRVFAEYHKKNLTDRGIDGFKLDECDNTNLVEYGWKMFPNCAEFPSGMDGEQYHNLFGVLYMKTILRALEGYPTLSEVRSAGALCASYPFVLYSDLYDHRNFIRGVVNAGFSGLLWSPELRHAESREDLLRRLQTVVFSVQCLINGWYCEEVPWKEYDCEEEVRELLRERERQIPRLMRAFERYHNTGIPPIRALVMDYTEDEQTFELDDEYLFGEDLLVAPMTAQDSARRVYLPEGSWQDYWTREPIACGWHEVCTDKIPVYRRTDIDEKRETGILESGEARNGGKNVSQKREKGAQRQL